MYYSFLYQIIRYKAELFRLEKRFTSPDTAIMKSALTSYVQAIEIFDMLQKLKSNDSAILAQFHNNQNMLAGASFTSAMLYANTTNVKAKKDYWNQSFMMAVYFAQTYPPISP
jgi:hypothetical protein